ncbi:hypothetical protein L3X38_013761 [Prunus dulcis]|uniref:Uncharacterized protein n=1 Tax=Prunus dulcis TaxID=3755 RepID=A0AAD4WM42_PRUDU|nr:hypothetical protein L3X38_013761 [Prunus dulcis]
MLLQNMEEVVVELAEHSRGAIIISFYNGLTAIFPNGNLPYPKRYENLTAARSRSSAVSSNALLKLARVRVPPWGTFGWRGWCRSFGIRSSKTLCQS